MHQFLKHETQFFVYLLNRSLLQKNLIFYSDFDGETATHGIEAATCGGGESATCGGGEAATCGGGEAAICGDQSETIGGAEIVEREEVDVGTASAAIERECVPVTQNGSEPADFKECNGCKEWEAKHNEMKKLCLRLTIRNADMDLKFEDLLRTKTSVNPVLTDDAALSTMDVFTPRELKFLECMPLEKKIDSTFVHHCLQYAYKHILCLAQKNIERKSRSFTNLG